MPCYNTAKYKRLQRVLHRQCNYTANDTKQRTRLYRCFSCYLTHSTAHDTRPTQADIIPPAPRRTLHKSAQPPIIIRYIGGAAVQHTADHASPAGSAPTVCGSLASATPGVSTEGVSVSTCTWSARHPPPGRAVQQQGNGGRRGTIDGYRHISFRAFAR